MILQRCTARHQTSGRVGVPVFADQEGSLPFSIQAGLKALKPYVSEDDQEIWKEFQTYSICFGV
jgi:hypothetical protein